jgi:eukaryotic-like serine/threonine-protein kinase
MAPNDELTTDYRSDGAGGEAPAGQLKVARVPGIGQLPTTDLQALLHKRLRFLAFFLATGMAVIVLVALIPPAQPWYASAFYSLIFAEFAVLEGVLWKKSSLCLRHLRLIELLLFGTLFAFWTLLHAGLYPTFRLDESPIWFGPVMANAICLPWVFIILVYGIFIPNNWRRCAAVAGTAAVVPVVVSITTGLSTNATRGHGPELFWATLGIWMVSAAAVAIYGAHRIEVFRVEASNARKLGQYQLKHRLGSGGMGEVYLAEHILLRRPCAVKLIRPDRTTDTNSFLRFEREVQVTATLTHPNTVQVFDYGHAEDGTFYYAMEYLPGLNLEELVKRHGPLPPERAVHLLRQACGALHEAHSVGLIHRDIKPNNIITCERGGLHDVAKLLDFGLVRSHGLGTGADNLTQEGALAGTPAYMSPEQADGKKDLDARSDIYSLGAVAYYLLTGQPPFVRPTPLQTLIAHACDLPIPPDQLRAGVPTDLQAVVLRCLEKDPAQRFPDTRSLVKALAGCQAAGLWTEERAIAWWQAQAGSANGASSVANATTRGA